MKKPPHGSSFIGPVLSTAAITGQLLNDVVDNCPTSPAGDWTRSSWTRISGDPARLRTRAGASTNKANLKFSGCTLGGVVSGREKEGQKGGGNNGGLLCGSGHARTPPRLRLQSNRTVLARTGILQTGEDPTGRSCCQAPPLGKVSIIVTNIRQSIYFPFRIIK
jgi:hypothetical protein